MNDRTRQTTGITSSSIAELLNTLCDPAVTPSVSGMWSTVDCGGLAPCRGGGLTSLAAARFQRNSKIFQRQTANRHGHWLPKEP